MPFHHLVPTTGNMFFLVFLLRERKGGGERGGRREGRRERGKVKEWITSRSGLWWLCKDTVPTGHPANQLPGILRFAFHFFVWLWLETPPPCVFLSPCPWNPGLFIRTQEGAKRYPGGPRPHTAQHLRRLTGHVNHARGTDRGQSLSRSELEPSD